MHFFVKFVISMCKRAFILKLTFSKKFPVSTHFSFIFNLIWSNEVISFFIRIEDFLRFFKCCFLIKATILLPILLFITFWQVGQILYILISWVLRLIINRVFMFLLSCKIKASISGCTSWILFLIFLFFLNFWLISFIYFTTIFLVRLLCFIISLWLSFSWLKAIIHFLSIRHILIIIELHITLIHQVLSQISRMIYLLLSNVLVSTLIRHKIVLFSHLLGRKLVNIGLVTI